MHTLIIAFANLHDAFRYLAHARDPKLMALLLPSVRLVAILRDPAKRAYSHFQMGCHREKKIQKYRNKTDVRVGRKSRVEMHNISGVFRANKDGGTVTKFPCVVLPHKRGSFLWWPDCARVVCR